MRYKHFFTSRVLSRPGRPAASLGERAQAIIIVAVSFVALLALVGLVTDVGSIYVSWTHLKRAVDAAAVAAANNLKSSKETISEAERLENMSRAAQEILVMNGIEDAAVMQIRTCEDLDDTNADGSPEVPLGNDLYQLCPTETGYRKLAWVEAKERVNVYFLNIIGIRSYPLTLSSIGEAAMLDLVLVFDTSESMGMDTLVPGGGTVGDYPDLANDFDPHDCNQNHNCQPLAGAKDAAKSLIKRLYTGFDRVAIVTYDYKAEQIFPKPPDGSSYTGLGMKLYVTQTVAGEMDAALAKIDSDLDLHDDAPLGRFAWDQRLCGLSGNPCVGQYNPVFPEDRDGDGYDADLGDCTPTDELQYPFRVDQAALAAAEAEVVPGHDINWFLDNPALCDLDDQFDVFDWDGNGFFNNDHDAGLLRWSESHDFDAFTFVSTCTGCGIRLGRQILAEYGRPGGVWVMVVLTDGSVNTSDSALTWPESADGIPDGYRSGFCTPFLISGEPHLWMSYENPCKDFDSTPRYCLDAPSSSCPPGTSHTGASALPSGAIGSATIYSPVDYAKDMVDAAGLLYPKMQKAPLPDPNPSEPNGEDIVMYAITFGKDTVALQQGVDLMHYLADVGEDGIRGGECTQLDLDNGGTAPYNEQCGNYYYAATSTELKKVFSDIMARIYTKISQ